MCGGHGADTVVVVVLEAAPFSLWGLLRRCRSLSVLVASRKQPGRGDCSVGVARSCVGCFAEATRRGGLAETWGTPRVSGGALARGVVVVSSGLQDLVTVCVVCVHDARAVHGRTAVPILSRCE